MKTFFLFVCLINDYFKIFAVEKKIYLCFEKLSLSKYSNIENYNLIFYFLAVNVIYN